MIAIFGGSFNPIHCGHVELARHIVSQGHADSVWLMVSPHNPLKASSGLLPEDIRYALATQAVSHVDGVEASDFELHLPRPSYTYATLRALRTAFPDEQFALLIGADNWLCFHRWAHPDEILRYHKILVYPRDGSPVDSSTLPTQVTCVEAPLYPYSSTEVRRRLCAGEALQGVLPAEISSEENISFLRSWFQK